MSSEKLCLKWNDFQERTLTSFKQLRDDKDFTDVTLASEDGCQVAAHKVVLAASSPLFHNLLKTNKNPHPLIYMRGLKVDHLVAMMDFLYSGEAKVLQENLDNFLAFANELQLKDLIGDQNIHDDVKHSLSPKKGLEEGFFSQVKPSLQRIGQIQAETLIEREVKNKPKRTDFVFGAAEPELDIDKQIKSMMHSTDHYITYKNGKQKRAFICKVCGKEAKDVDIRRHIEAMHIRNVSRICDICGKTSSSRNGLRNHIFKVHNNSHFGTIDAC